MKKIAVVLVSVMLLAPGCTGRVSLTSEHDDDATGVLYHLPKTVLNITVRRYHNKTTGRIWYTLGGPGATKNKATDAAPDYKVIDEHEILSETVPDAQHRYVIKYQPSAFSDDRLCISRKPNGLLFDVQFAADDRTPQIIFNIARFIGGFIGGPKKASFLQGTLADVGETIIFREHTDQVDPFDNDDIDEFNKTLKHVFDGEHIRIDFSRMRKLLARSAKTWPAGCSIEKGCTAGAWAKRCDEEHICYRTKLSVPIDLEFEDEAIDMKYAEVINAWDIGSISVRRAFLVQKITKLRFDDGALVSAIVRKPSEVEEASLIPVNIVNAILSVPSGLWASAFSDEEFNLDVLEQVSKYQSAVAALNEKVNNAKLEGAAPIESKAESYHLNCGVAKRGGSYFNILSGAGGAN